MRAWAQAHPKEVRALQAALSEAETFVNTEPDKTKAAVARYLKMPPDLVKLLKIGVQHPTLTPQQLQWWIDVMRQNGMLAGDVDAAKMILPR